MKTIGNVTTEVKDDEPLPQNLSSLVAKIAAAYKTEILGPAEKAVREWLKEISDEKIA